MWLRFIAFSLLATVSCKPRAYNDGAEAAGASTDCKAEVFADPGRFPAGNDGAREPLLSQVVALKEFSNVTAKLKLAPHKTKQWVLAAITPVNMGFCSVAKSDITKKYDGEAQPSYVKNAEAVVKVFDDEDWKSDFAKLPKPQQSDLGDIKNFPDLSFLRTANVWVSPVESAGKIRNIAAYDTVPVTPEQKEIVRKSELASILWFSVKNGSELLYYPSTDTFYDRGFQIGILHQWQNEIATLAKASDDAFVVGIANAYRKCIAIHPFADGNGRTCKLWAIHALLRRNIPHPLLWAGDDILIAQQEWHVRFKQGIDLHRNFLDSLSR